MPDRRMVVKGLECCTFILGKRKCNECPYQKDNGCYQLQDDFHALLKEQEAKNVVNMTLSKDRFLIASCPKCNALLTRVEHKNYCGYCGQAVKWE